ncbi:MAG: ATP-binding protein [Pseudomonadota bacterium]
MTRIRLWPVGLTGRVTLVLLLAILIEFAGTVLLFGEAERLMLRTGEAHRVAEQLVVADRVLTRTAPDDRAHVAPGLSTRHVSFDYASAPPGTLIGGRVADAALREILSWEPSLEGRTLRLGVTRGNKGGNRMVGALQTRDGAWIHFQSREPVSRWHAPVDWLLSLLFLAGAVLVVTALLVRTLAAPLRALAQAANRIGFADSRVRVESTGPQELRRLADAFNAMQTRIAELLESRTQALLAVSHDLRTPLARMKLRLGGGERPEDRIAMRADVDEMQDMLDSLLDYLGGGSELDSDPAERTNLAALAQLIVEQQQDMGAEASYKGPDRLDAVLHRVALRRAIANLVENAIKYGGCAEVALTRDGGDAVLAVADRGPGIAAEALPHVTEPFYRADEARARSTRGLGLGLAVVARVVAAHGGTLTLTNREQGLVAAIRLPIAGKPPVAPDEMPSGNLLIRF